METTPVESPDNTGHLQASSGEISPFDKSILDQSSEKNNSSSQGKLPEKINIDGIERWTVNSKGLPIAQNEESIRNFWNWFGDSKVVDENGKPLVVYHGTESTTSEISNSQKSS